MKVTKKQLEKMIKEAVTTYMNEVGPDYHGDSMRDASNAVGFDVENPPVSKYSSAEELLRDWSTKKGFTVKQLIKHAVALGFSVGKDVAWAQAEKEMTQQRDDYRYMEDDY